MNLNKHASAVERRIISYRRSLNCGPERIGPRAMSNWPVAATDRADARQAWAGHVDSLNPPMHRAAIEVEQAHAQAYAEGMRHGHALARATEADRQLLVEVRRESFSSWVVWCNARFDT